MEREKKVSYYQAIRAALEPRRDEIVRRLIDLASIPSVRGEAAPGAPFGTACKDALDAVEKLYSACGYPTDMRGDSGYLLAHAGNARPNAKKTIGVFAHADVVPVGEGWIFTKPFEPIEKDGVLIGRGVYDNKAGILMGLYAAQMIEELGLPLRSELLLGTGSNEETAMEDMQAFAAQETMPDVSLVPDNGFPVSRGERGILRFYALSDQKLSDRVLSVSGGNAFNAVLGTATVVLRDRTDIEDHLRSEIGKNENLTLDVDRKSGNGTLTLCAHGITGHAAAPGNAVHGIYLLAKALSACPGLTDTDRAIFEDAAELTRDCYGAGLGIASVDPDFGRLTCVNGIASVEDGRLSLSYDIRYGMTWEPTRLEDAVTEWLHSLGWKYVPHENSPGYMIPADSPFVTALLDTYKACTGHMNAASYLSSGGTYARELKNAFSMCDVHCKPPFEVPAGHGGAHQPDEMVSIDGLLDSTAILATMILACDELLNGEEPDREEK